MLCLSSLSFSAEGSSPTKTFFCLDNGQRLNTICNAPTCINLLTQVGGNVTVKWSQTSTSPGPRFIVDSRVVRTLQRYHVIWAPASSHIQETVPSHNDPYIYWDRISIPNRSFLQWRMYQFDACEHATLFGIFLPIPTRLIVNTHSVDCCVYNSIHPLSFLQCRLLLCITIRCMEDNVHAAPSATTLTLTQHNM